MSKPQVTQSISASARATASLASLPASATDSPPAIQNNTARVNVPLRLFSGTPLQLADVFVEICEELLGDAVVTVLSVELSASEDAQRRRAGSLGVYVIAFTVQDAETLAYWPASKVDSAVNPVQLERALSAILASSTESPPLASANKGHSSSSSSSIGLVAGVAVGCIALLVVLLVFVRQAHARKVHDSATASKADGSFTAITVNPLFGSDGTASLFLFLLELA